MAQMIANAIRQAGTNFVESLSVFLPRMITTLAIIIVGWLIAMLLRTMVRAVAGWLRINVAAERFGVTPLLKTADLPPADVLLGAIVFWLVWLGFLLSDSGNNGRIDRIFLAIILLAVLGKLTDSLLGLFERWAMKKWA